MAGDFRRLWAASTVSSLGDGVRLSALPLLAARLTRDPGQVALVSAAQGAAWLAFGLPSGALADRWDRRRTMIACDLVRCALMLLLTGIVAVGHTSIWLLVGVSFLLVTADTLFYGAVQAAIPTVVASPDLERANGRLHAANVLGTGFLGPPTGAALFVLHPAVPFTLDAASFLLAAALASRLRADLSPGAAGVHRSWLGTEVADGLRWLWAHHELRTIMVLLTIWNVAEGGIFGVLVLWSLHTLRLSEAGYGVLVAALAAGGMAGSLLADRLGRSVGPGRALTASVAVTVVAYAALGVTHRPAMALILMAVVGVVAFVWNVITASFRQSVVPGPLQGRVGSAYRFATWGVVAVGAVLGGATASRWGLQAPFLVAAVTLTAAGTATLPWLSDQRLAAARAAAQG